MTTEEKARRYDEAITKARNIVNSINVGLIGKNSFEAVFPELKESEDEKIRKALRERIIRYDPNNEILIKEEGISQRQFIDWIENQNKKTEPIAGFVSEFERQVSHLIASAINREHEYNKGYVKWAAQSLIEYAKREIEKQGEQKPADKVEPKFKVGDTIQPKDRGHEPWQIMQVDILDKEYRFKGGYVIHFSQENNYELVEKKPTDEVEPKFHEGDWIIGDKDNTVHQVKTAIENVSNGKYAYDLIDGGYISTSHESDYHLWTIQDARDGDVLYSLDSNLPFIYQERKPHEQATAYCGINIYGKFFIWNTKDCIITTDKYIPATKEQRDTLEKAMVDAGYTFDFEKKELKKIEQKPDSGGFWEGYNTAKEKFEQKSSWSEEDRKMSRFIGNAITADDASMYLKSKGIQVIDAHAWLEELKDRVQPKQEWSEEDCKHLESILIRLDDVIHNTFTDTCYSVNEDVNWLKSLRPQKQWKPSDEQIEALEHSLGDYNIKVFEERYEILKSLYQDLKKLRGK